MEKARALLEKETLLSMFRNKLLILTVAILAATIVLAILFRPLAVLVVAIGFPAASIVGIMFFLSWTPPKPIPRPSRLGIKTEQKEILADGKSTTTITVELLDKEGKPIQALEDTEIEVSATKGKMATQTMKIPKGKQTETTVLTSTTEIGQVTVSANASGLKSTSTTLDFAEKKRYCMHCGNMVSFTAKLCQKCGKAPPAGVDTRVCKNCTSVIPVVAKFCSECGASQPE